MPFTTGLFDVASPPGGLPLCCWSCCCFPCAAGDVAQNTGGNYCSTCAWFFLSGPCTIFIGAPFACIMRCRDRRATVTTTNITDDTAPCLDGLKIVCCAPCSVAQELRELAHAQTGASKDMDVFSTVACRVPTSESIIQAIPFCGKVLVDTCKSGAKAAMTPMSSIKSAAGVESGAAK